MISDRAEEILEGLWIELIEHKKEIYDVSILKDNEAVKELLGAGCVKIKDDKINLTYKGEEEGKGCVRRHRLAERLMADVFDLKKKNIHETSCEFEHLLHKGLDDNICTLLGHPKKCPHGKSIPEGSCCKDIKRVPQKLVMSLAELQVNKKATVSYLHTNDRNTLQKIIAMGVLPKTDIRLIQKFPSYVFQLGLSQFAIDKELAQSIFVRVI